MESSSRPEGSADTDDKEQHQLQSRDKEEEEEEEEEDDDDDDDENDSFADILRKDTFFPSELIACEEETTVAVR